MSKPKFVYVTFIRTTLEQLWSALTSPEFTRKYWFGVHPRDRLEEPARRGKCVFPDGRGLPTAVKSSRSIVPNASFSNGAMNSGRS